MMNMLEWLMRSYQNTMQESAPLPERQSVVPVMPTPPQKDEDPESERILGQLLSEAASARRQHKSLTRDGFLHNLLTHDNSDKATSFPDFVQWGNTPSNYPRFLK